MSLAPGCAQLLLQQQKPWTKDPHYFKRVKISALALLKMVVHARSGGNIEVGKNRLRHQEHRWSHSIVPPGM